MRFIALLLLFMLGSCSSETEQSDIQALQQGGPSQSDAQKLMPSPLVFEPQHVTMGSVKEGDNAVVYLRVRNSGAEMEQIVGVETSCGCSVAEPEEHLLMPGSYTRIRVTVDTFAKQDDVTKWVLITDGQGRISKAWLTLEVKANPHLARKGRSIFDGKCGACHFDPAENKSDGADIYSAVCAMCHGVDAEGANAPALRGLDGDALSVLIAHGTGSQHMPGFARAEGGPLSPEQVSALSQWLSALDAKRVSR